MQANCSQLHSPPGAVGNEDASATQCVHTKLTGEGSCLHSGDVHIQINSIPKEYAENPTSRNTRSGVHSCTHGCIHSRFRSHSQNEARQPDDSATESGDHGSSSFSEFRSLFKWLHKSLPYILILGVKLVMQHITGISLGIGLLTTFMYANKSIVNQVFLRERCSKIQCAWLLVFLAGSSVLLYYTFHSQSLYYSLIFLNPTLDNSSFWEVLWIVGITDFILKFLFMGLKCLILLMPSFIMPFKSKGYWYMLLEESSFGLFWTSENFPTGFTNIFYTTIMEWLPARDSVQMWTFVQYVKLNFKNQFCSSVSIHFVKNALPYGLTERKHVHCAEL
ncbi:E3 ubiquitin-protein ligase RNFT1 isoform X4 [Callorhinus ursinus]|uniref:E3 ubiquitin-protein ligase RNFT1 isoform X4 n=1 Tax=Callorhinus ursinus TaxID=34884 RepID=UPI003CD01FCF